MLKALLSRTFYFSLVLFVVICYVISTAWLIRNGWYIELSKWVGGVVIAVVLLYAFLAVAWAVHQWIGKRYDVWSEATDYVPVRAWLKIDPEYRPIPNEPVRHVQTDAPQRKVTDA